ncbi:acetylserotonin O-methyltransferase [Nematostella vectensis]|uniref:acetylserotonin O-methyltransferase n=1 Tax=Nematostella vectensis TaxID=45351 RepID=UPI0020776236|nr:acetylserotonin O-methyltransferase [Nematostella vectensis]
MAELTSTLGTIIPTSLSDIFHGFVKSNVLFTACELGIFDVLCDKHSAEHVAENVKPSCKTGSTRRLLDTLVAMQLLVKEMDSDPPVYFNSQTAEAFLTRKSPKSLISYFEFLHATTYKLFDNLKHAVVEEEPQWQRAFDQPASEIYKILHSNKEKLMRIYSRFDCVHRLEAPGVMSAFDLNPFKHMCDLGGGTGCFSYEACKQYPALKITIYEMQPILDVAPAFKPTIADCPNQSNVTYVAGDFFKDPLPVADLYFLAHVLHNWAEEKVDLLLSKVFAVLPPGGGILLGEVLLPVDEPNPQLSALFMDLSMLVTCESGARDRSGPEYKRLLERHGFQDVRMKSLPGAKTTDAVFARKP